MAALKTNLDEFRPKGVVIADESEDPARRAAYLSALPNTTCGLYWRWFGAVSIAYSWLDKRDCYQQILAAERARGRQYDLVAKARTDNQYCDAWPSYDTFDWGHFAATRTIATPHRPVKHSWAHDRVIDGNSAIMLRTHSDIYFRAHEQLLSCQKESDYRKHCDGYIAPECYLGTWLANNRLNFDNGIKPGSGSIGVQKHCTWRTESRTKNPCSCTNGTFSVRWIDH